MIKIDAELVRELRETANWLLEFPEKVVAAILKPREEFLRRRERIQKLKEIVELREIGKSIQIIFRHKGGVVHWVQSIQSGQDIEQLPELREMFNKIASGLDDLKAIVSETSVSDTNLGAEATMFLARAALAHRQLAGLPNEALLNDRDHFRNRGVVREND